MSYIREQKITCDEIPDRGYRIAGELKDDLHHFTLVLGIDFMAGEIFEAQAAALKTPFPICGQAMQSIEKLVGVKVGPGLTKKVNAALIGPEGCFHLAELVLSAVNAGLQASARQIPAWIPHDVYARTWKAWEQGYMGKCIHYAQPEASETLDRVFTEVLPGRQSE